MSTPEEHSHLGPSSWERWVRCPGAPSAESGLPDTTGFEAAEGTAFHEWVSDCLELGLEPEDFLGAEMVVDGHTITCDEEMCRSARDGIDYVRAIAAQPNVELFVETRVDISPWTLPGQFGTADVILIHPEERWMIVFDWKYGKEPVYPQENYQLQGYALGAWETTAWSYFGDPAGVDVTLVIEQPRVPGAGGAWKTTMSRILEFGDHVRRQAVLSTDPNAPRHPGQKQCRWCKARDRCGAYAEWHLENIGLDFDDLDEGFTHDLEPLLPEDITPERRSYLLKIRPMINQWLDAMHKTAYHDATVGKPTPGLKLVEGRRPARSWSENQEHKAEQALVGIAGQNAYKPRELLSPSQAEKKVGKKVYLTTLKRFVDEGEPSLILVPEEDRREAKKTAIDEFDEL